MLIELMQVRAPNVSRLRWPVDGAVPILHPTRHGTVAGDPVFGLSLLDHVWSKPGRHWVLTEAFLEIEPHWSMGLWRRFAVFRRHVQSRGLLREAP